MYSLCDGAGKSSAKRRRAFGWWNEWVKDVIGCEGVDFANGGGMIGRSAGTGFGIANPVPFGVIIPFKPNQDMMFGAQYPSDEQRKLHSQTSPIVRSESAVNTRRTTYRLDKSFEIDNENSKFEERL